MINIMVDNDSLFDRSVIAVWNLLNVNFWRAPSFTAYNRHQLQEYIKMTAQLCANKLLWEIFIITQSITDDTQKVIRQETYT